MNPIVRRATPTFSVQVTGEQIPHTYREDGIVVGSQLTLDVEPRLSLAWRVEPRHWNDGFTLLVFHNTTGFCPYRDPVDLNWHGQLIVETKQDDCVTHVPEEGTHFFTFVLHRKRGLFKWFERLSEPLRFSETVPSVKVALGRTRDLADLEETLRRNEIGRLAHQANLNEQKLRRLRSLRQLEEYEKPPAKVPQSGINPLIAEELEDFDASIDAIDAKNRKTEEFKKSEQYKRMTPTQRKAALKNLDDLLDPAEIRARMEMRRRQKKG